MNQPLKLYSYWRSSASYRVRIALNLKALKYEVIPVNLMQSEQNDAAFDEQNPQHMVPVLMHGERVMRQSLAIIEWLEDSFEGRGYPLLAHPPRERVRIRTLSNVIAADIAPLNVLRIVNYLGAKHGFSEGDKKTWMQHWMREGFIAFERMLDNPSTGAFCEGDEPTMADCCLIPQVYNALRWDLDMSAFPRMQEIYQRALELPEFAEAAPEQQIDAPKN
jgi:maleylacetoacetate isomerase